MKRFRTHLPREWSLVVALGCVAAACGDASSDNPDASNRSAGTRAAGATSSAGGPQAASGGAFGQSGRSGDAGAVALTGAGGGAGTAFGGSGAPGSAIGGSGAAIAGGAGLAGTAAATAGSGGTIAVGGFAAGGGPSGGARNTGGSAGGAAAHSGAWRITPLGDSITGSTCAPQLLSRELKDKGHANFGFFGSNLNNQSCSSAPNVQTEGHGGYLVTDLVGNGKHASELSKWAASDKAEVVLMHFGTNDVWNNVAPSAILSAFSSVLASFRAINPKLVLFVAQIIPMNPSGCSACEGRVAALNAQIPGWASSAATAQSPIYVVDQHSVFSAATYTPSSTYTEDGVHPNAAGAQLIADKWYAALTEHGLP